jgi:hypothetical protein
MAFTQATFGPGHADLLEARALLVESLMRRGDAVEALSQTRLTSTRVLGAASQRRARDLYRLQIDAAWAVSGRS